MKHLYNILVVSTVLLVETCSFSKARENSSFVEEYLGKTQLDFTEDAEDQKFADAQATYDFALREIKYVLPTYLRSAAWKKAQNDPKKKEQLEERMRGAIKIALQLNDTEIIKSLLFALGVPEKKREPGYVGFGPLTPGPKAGADPEELNWFKEHQPDLLSPAARGLLESYEPSQVRKSMALFISNSDYGNLTEFEKHVFQSLWLKIDAKIAEDKNEAAHDIMHSGDYSVELPKIHEQRMKVFLEDVKQFKDKEKKYSEAQEKKRLEFEKKDKEDAEKENNQ